MLGGFFIVAIFIVRSEPDAITAVLLNFKSINLMPETKRDVAVDDTVKVVVTPLN